MKLPKKKKPKTKAEPIFKPQWELFCRYYTQNDDLFGNATHSYAEAYGYKLDDEPRDDAEYEEIEFANGEVRRGAMIRASSYDRAVNVCAVEGKRLLRKPQIQARLTELLNELLTDKVIDSQLAKVAMQDRDLSAKMQAIKEYNALRTRITKKMELTGADGAPLFTDEHKHKSKSAVSAFLRGNPGKRG